MVASSEEHCTCWLSVCPWQIQGMQFLLMFKTMYKTMFKLWSLNPNVAQRRAKLQYTSFELNLCILQYNLVLLWLTNSIYTACNISMARVYLCINLCTNMTTISQASLHLRPRGREVLPHPPYSTALVWTANLRYYSFWIILLHNQFSTNFNFI